MLQFRIPDSVRPKWNGKEQYLLATNSIEDYYHSQIQCHISDLFAYTTSSAVLLLFIKVISPVPCKKFDGQELSLPFVTRPIPALGIIYYIYSTR